MGCEWAALPHPPILKVDPRCGTDVDLSLQSWHHLDCRLGPILGPINCRQSGDVWYTFPYRVVHNEKFKSPKLAPVGADVFGAAVDVDAAPWFAPVIPVFGVELNPGAAVNVAAFGVGPLGTGDLEGGSGVDTCAGAAFTAAAGLGFGFPLGGGAFGILSSPFSDSGLFISSSSLSSLRSSSSLPG